MIRKPLQYLLCLLLIKTILLGLVIAFYQIGLSPDEAQYWTWSQNLDWGYYSKPPAIAWQIWGFTSLLGSTSFTVRASALFIGFCLSLAIYYLAKCCKLNDKTAFWAAVAMAFSPLGIYLSLAATTDGGAILFLVLAIAQIAKGLEEEKGPNYPLTGLWIFLGALYKWTAFILWPLTLLFFLFTPKMRKSSPIWGILISLAALLPPLYWNMTHDFATFKHVAGAVGTKKGGNFFDFLGAQIGLISPIFFGLLVISYCYLFKKKNRALIFCSSFPLLVSIYLTGAFFSKMQPNWAAYLYPPGMVLIAWFAFPKRKIWLHIGTYFSILIIAVMFSIPWLQNRGIFSIPYKINPFRHQLGLDKIDSALTKAGYDPDTHFLMGDKYQIASLLSFYGPKKKQAYFFNISGIRKNQFSYWPQMHEKEIGKTGYFVVIENKPASAVGWYEKHYQKQLAPYFKKISFKGAYPLFMANGKNVKYVMIFKCIDYLGTSPSESDIY